MHGKSQAISFHAGRRCEHKCATAPERGWKRSNVRIPFGNLAISSDETHGFASRPRGRFAFVEELNLSSADD